MSSQPPASSRQLYHHIIVVFLLLLLPPPQRGDENYLTRADINDGQLFPVNVTTTVGETLYMRIMHAVTDQQWCRYRRPGGPDVIVTDDEGENRVSGWPGQTCGIRVWNVTATDWGHWRLTSSNVGNVTRGYTFVTVQDISLDDYNNVPPLRSPDEPITPPGSRYCYVLRPDQDVDSFPQHENCTIPRAATSPGLDDDDVLSNGRWNVVVGLDGQTEELRFAVNVQADVEELQSNVVVNNASDTIRMACNLVQSTKKLSFCRFQRLSDGRGFNVQPAQGSSRYSYWGNGFAAGECGLTVSGPNDLDRSTWKCFVGYDRQGTMGAILDASTVPTKLNDVIGDDVYGLNGTSVNIMCKAFVSIDYCWFSHPMGQRISVSDRAAADDNTFIPRYFGVGLRMGECGITLPQALLNDSGVWRCHLGTYRPVGFEVQQNVTVRISDSNLVSTASIIDVLDTASFYVNCTSIPMLLPVEYCRFVMPNGRGFSINENTTQDNALDGIYFHPDHRLIDGLCSIIVQSVQEIHAGSWTCAARLVGRSSESTDDFVVRIDDAGGISVVALVFICVGSLIAVALLVFLGIRYYRQNRRTAETPPSPPATPDESVSLEHESPL